MHACMHAYTHIRTYIHTYVYDDDDDDNEDDEDEDEDEVDILTHSHSHYADTNNKDINTYILCIAMALADAIDSIRLYIVNSSCLATTTTGFLTWLGFRWRFHGFRVWIGASCGVA